MANRNFVVHNGLTVGPTTIDATTGNITVTNLTITGTSNVAGSSGALVISTNGTADSLRITQAGTGNVLVVEDSANPDSTPFVISPSGNVGIGNAFPTAPLSFSTDIGGAGVVNKIQLYPGYGLGVSGNELGVIGAANIGLYNGTTLRVKISSTLVDFTNNVNVMSTSTSTSSSTGALKVMGGVGVAGNVYTGGIVNITSTTESSSVSTGALIVDGGAGIAKNAFVGGNVSIASTVNSTSTGTGALVVSGGVGIAGNVTIGGNISVLGTLTTFNSNTVTIQDALIQLAPNNTGDILDIGLAASYTSGNLRYTGLVRDATDSTWKLFDSVTLAPDTTIDFTSATYSSLQLGSIIASSGTAATSTTTGAIRVTGGAGVTGNIHAANVTSTFGLFGTLYTAAQTNITSVGTLTSLAVSGAITVNSGNNTTAIVNGGTNGTGNIGATGATFNTVFAKATTAQYADLAEIYASDSQYDPGTVVIFGGTHEVTISTISHSPAVAGVVSTNPGFLMNEAAEGVAVALQGRVPCKVLGPINKGDRVVTSHIHGVAERLDPSKYQPGCIIGKSLETFSETDIKTIEVVVGRN